MGFGFGTGGFTGGLEAVFCCGLGCADAGFCAAGLAAGFVFNAGAGTRCGKRSGGGGSKPPSPGDCCGSPIDAVVAGA